MAGRKKRSTMDALVAYMKKHPNAAYADARDSLAKGGHTIFPIMWGRAQVLLGRVKAKKRGTAGKKKAAAARKTGKRTGKKTGKKAGKKAGKARKKTARKAAGRRPGRRAAAGDIQIDAADLDRWQGLVDHLNGGGKVALQYDGSGWVLTTSA